RRLEADRRGRAGVADSSAAGHERGPAVLPARGDEPAAPGVVRPRAPGREPVSTVRDLELRLADRAPRLPVPRRAVPGRGGAGARVVVAFCFLCSAMRRRGVADAEGRIALQRKQKATTTR